MSETHHLISPDPSAKRTRCCFRRVNHLPVGDWATFSVENATCLGIRVQRAALWMMALGGLALLALVAGCQDLGSLSSQSCEHNGCPAGQVCAYETPGGHAAYTCYRADMVPDGFMVIDMAKRDMVLVLPPDMVNPYAWNPSQAAGPAPGCASNVGWRLTDKLYACPGLRSAGTAACATAWSLPATLTIPESACASVPWGFFAGQPHGLSNMFNDSEARHYDWQPPDSTWKLGYRWGCGRSGRYYGAMSGRPYTAVAVNRQGGFPTVAFVGDNIGGFNQIITPLLVNAPASPYRESYFPQYTATQSTNDGDLCAQP